MTALLKLAFRLTAATAFVAAVATRPPTASHAQSGVDTLQYLKLVDHLDRPEDGYCLDIPGAGGHFRLDKPLTAHNCKPGAAPDGVIQHRANGTLWFSALDLCVTAMGTNGNALPGAALMAKPCVEDAAFADSSELKRFEFTDDQKLALTGSDLCLVAGPRSAPTFSASHRWRTLYLDDCESAPRDRSQWAMVEAYR